MEEITLNFVVFGFKWFDKINGNTYNRAIIKCIEWNDKLETRFQYGYGSCYFWNAKEVINNYVKNTCIGDFENIKINIIDMGSYYTTKRIAKNAWEIQ